MRSFNGESLFLSREKTSVPLIKTANIKLNKDPEEWEEEVLEFLHEQHPYIADFKIQVKINKTDEETGAGLGVILIDDKVAIPLIVDQFKLQPLDVFFHDDQLYALTRSSIEAILQDTNIGKPVKPGKGEASDVSLVNMVTPPYDGKYTFASALEYTKSQLQDALSGAFTETGLTYEVSANSAFRDVLHDYVQNATEPIEQVKEASGPTKRLEIVNADTFSKCAKSGIYEVDTSNGLDVGMVFTHQVRFNAPDVMRNDNSMYLSLEKTSWAQTQKDIGTREAKKLTKLAANVATGRGVFWTGKDTPVCTEPFDILWKTGEAVKIKTLGNEIYTVYWNPKYTDITKLGSDIYMSSNWMFKKLGEEVHLSDPNSATLVNNAPATGEIRHVNNRFVVDTEDPAFDKIAREGVRHDVILNDLGVTFEPGGLEAALNEAVEKDSVRFRVYDAEGVVKTAQKKLSSEPVLSKEVRMALTATAACFDDRILKEAKMVGSEETKKTIDSVLGLNFLSQQNIYKFVDNLEKVSDAKTAVAELLLASRLGLDIDGSPLRTALYALDEVERDLKELRNTSNTRKI